MVTGYNWSAGLKLPFTMTGWTQSNITSKTVRSVTWYIHVQPNWSVLKLRPTDVGTNSSLVFSSEVHYQVNLSVWLPLFSAHKVRPWRSLDEIWSCQYNIPSSKSVLFVMIRFGFILDNPWNRNASYQKNQRLHKVSTFSSKNNDHYYLDRPNSNHYLEQQQLCSLWFRDTVIGSCQFILCRILMNTRRRHFFVVFKLQKSSGLIAQDDKNFACPCFAQEASNYINL